LPEEALDDAEQDKCDQLEDESEHQPGLVCSLHVASLTHLHYLDLTDTRQITRLILSWHSMTPTPTSTFSRVSSQTRPTRRHPRENPRENVGVVKCGLISSPTSSRGSSRKCPCRCRCRRRGIPALHYGPRTRHGHEEAATATITNKYEWAPIVNRHNDRTNIFIGPIPWGHSGPLCHALSLSSSSLALS